MAINVDRMERPEARGKPRSIGAALQRNAQLYPYDEAVTDGTVRLSWQELSQRVESACAQLRNLGIKAGDRIAVVLSNQIEALVLYWACALWKAVFVGANPRLGRDDLHRIIEHSGASLLFIAESVDPGAIPANVRSVVVIERSDPASFFAANSPLDSEVLPVVDENDVFAIVYTSGTTGPAKGAILTHANLMWCAEATAQAMEITKADTFLVCVQLTHIFGLSAAILVAALRGARCVLMREHSASRALDLCEWEGVTIHHGTPTMFTLELAAQRRAPRDLSSLRTGIVAAAPVTPELADAIRAELHCDIQMAWGLTETSPTVTITHSDDPTEERRSSVGRALPDAEIAFADLGGEYGEVLVRSPGVFKGYYNDPAASAMAFTKDGFFRSGDLGWLDAKGFLHLAGRHKEIIIRGALHVYPDELETLISSLQWVHQVAVVGVPDRVLGERICACVVVDPTSEVPDDLLGALRAAIAGRLADYKQPDYVVRMTALPLSVGGKVLKALLREDAMARVTAQ